MSRKTTNLSKPNLNSGHNGLTQAHKSTQPKLAKYIGFFVIGYMLASVIFMIIQTKMALNSPLVTVISIIVGAYIAVHKFIKHQQRALNRNESNRLMFGSVAIVWLLTIIYLLGIWFWLFDSVSREVLFEMTKQQPLPLLASMILILVMTLVSARISILLLNRLLDPKRKTI